MFNLGKFSLIILTRCNLRCRLCCEYVPKNKPFEDMTIGQEQAILDAFFNVVDHVNILHLTGGGEPFLHPELSGLIEKAMEYKEHFDNLMLFTNGTVPMCDNVLDTMVKHNNKILLQVSQYHIRPEIEKENEKILIQNRINCRVRKYYGDNQDFGGWVDFGNWKSRNRSTADLNTIFHECSVTRVMNGNWRTRDGKVHWCSRSQRGTELGLIPDNSDYYIDLFDKNESITDKQNKFLRIANGTFLYACDYCSGDQGTDDMKKRHPAAEQIV